MATETVWNRDGYTISTHKSFLDLEIIYNYLHNESYWAKGIDKQRLISSIENTALCFGLFEGNPNVLKKQIGFARVISDLNRFAYLADVFILDAYQGRGFGKWLVSVITSHED